jgi:hypothetical protein
MWPVQASSMGERTNVRASFMTPCPPIKQFAHSRPLACIVIYLYENSVVFGSGVY